MKKIFTIISILIIITFIVSVDVFAFDFEEDSGMGETGDIAGFSDVDNSATIEEVMGQVIKTTLSYIGVFFLGLMIYAGYIWMMARGNEQDVEKARKILQNAIIGLIIVVAAYAITMMIGGVLETKPEVVETTPLE